ncbi:PepSY domain-containing protein, partial [Pseudomonas aeruginosa]
VCGGLPLASLALLWGNRLLPTQLAGRDTWEIRVFCASWALVALWAIVRRNSGTLGRTQLRLAAVLALGLPLLGLLRSPEGNLLASLQRGDWVLAGV